VNEIAQATNRKPLWGKRLEPSVRVELLAGTPLSGIGCQNQKI
jgi:hypothetical protein